MSRYEPCPVDGCAGDARYAPPGRGHSCTWHDWITARTTLDSPDETPRATLAEDERAVAEVLAAHEFTVHEPAKPILDEQPFRMTEAIWGCVCGWRETNEALTEEEIPGDHFRDHVVEHLAPLLAAARAAGVAQGRAEGLDRGVRQAITWLRADYEYGTGPEWRENGAEWIAEQATAARIAEGAEQ